jgi:hypothetical protein
MQKVKLPTFECLRCGHTWHPKKEERPRCCGFCKNPRWDTPSDKESSGKAKHIELCGTCHPVELGRKT